LEASIANQFNLILVEVVRCSTGTCCHLATPVM